MAKFQPPGGSQILLYVDDVLLASPDTETCEKDSKALLRHLAAEGHKVSKGKLQFCQTHVKYLGHTLSAGGRTIIAERKTAVLQAPKPITKKQMMSFLGLTGYCRSWIPNYAEIVGPLQKLMYNEDLKMSSTLKWTPEAEQAFCTVKQALVSSTTLALPDYSKKFIQTVDCKGHYMTSLLMQQHGSKMRPVAYYSSKLDAVACALPHCVKAVIAASMAVEVSSTVVLFHPLTLKVPHAVSALLLQTNMISCMTNLLLQPHLTIERCTVLNPATLLPLPDDGSTHDCQAEAETVSKSRSDLLDTPLQEGEVIFVDGSSKKSDTGLTQTGFSVVTATKVLKAEPLPRNYSAQAAELVALAEACRLMKGKKVTIYTDSQYAFCTVHTFAQYWKNRGMVTSTGKPVTHAALLTELLSAVQLPSEVAICKCAAHTGGTDPVSLGNAFADKIAKQAAERTPTLALQKQMQETTSVDSTVLREMQEQSPQSEHKSWENRGATKKDGIYV